MLVNSLAVSNAETPRRERTTMEPDDVTPIRSVKGNGDQQQQLRDAVTAAVREALKGEVAEQVAQAVKRELQEHLSKQAGPE